MVDLGRMTGFCKRCRRVQVSLDAWTDDGREGGTPSVCADLADASTLDCRYPLALQDCAEAYDRWQSARVAELEAQVARLTAELAEARQPGWDDRVLVQCRPVPVAIVSRDAEAWSARVLCSSEWVLACASADTVAEAKKAAELACGVEAKDGDV